MQKLFVLTETGTRVYTCHSLTKLSEYLPIRMSVAHHHQSTEIAMAINNFM